MTTPNHIIPTLQYEDPKAAISWLCAAFGFEKKVAFEEGGIIVHAQLTYRGNMIMLGASNRNSPYNKLITSPAACGGHSTQAPYIIVEDMDAHYQQAINHGARIALDLKTEDFGGKSYSCFDLEGHLWNFGSYDPWA